MRLHHALFALPFLLSPALGQEVTWLTDFEAAKSAAKEADKLVLADFTGSDWCGWCIKLKEEVFSKPEFAAWAQEHVVLLELDFPRKTEQDPKLKEQNEALAKQYGIEGYPTVLLLDGEGEKVGELGYVEGGPEAWIAKADEQLRVAQARKLWTTDYKAALKQARKERKLILADFTGSDWCGWCIKLKDEVFNTPEFLAWAEDGVVLLELDFPRKKELDPELKKQNDELAEEFGIRGYPTILFLDAKGKKVGKTGYVEGGPRKWLEAAEEEMGSYGKKLRKQRLSRERKQDAAAKKKSD